MAGYDGSRLVDLSVFDRRCTDRERDIAVLDPLLAGGVGSNETYKIHNKIIFELINVHTDHLPRYTYEHIVKVLEDVKEIFKAEPPLVECRPNIQVVGDLHGSLYDMRRIYNNFRERLTDRSYIPAHIVQSFCFLGNYVDRGEHSLELLMLLFSMKITSQFSGQRVILLRGNHETREMNYAKGFRAELHAKFEKAKADDLFERLNDVFDHMPLACLIAKRHLCVHGGISPKLISLDSIRKIPKPLKRVDKNKLACDLLWADFKEGLKGFEPNAERDISVYFGKDILEETLDRLRVEFLIRSHQKTAQGCEFNGLMLTVTSFSGKNKKTDIGLVRIHNNGYADWGVMEPTAGLKAFEMVKVKQEPERGDFVIEMGDC